MDSIWNDTAVRPCFPALKGNRNVDVLIIGGGITGILCAYLLKQAGVNYMLVEQDVIAGGVTENTTAKITAQHGLIFQNIAKKYGLEAAGLYYDANKEACEIYERICQFINCDYEKKDSYVYSLTSEKELVQELSIMERIGCPGKFAKHLPLPLETQGAVCLPAQAQFNPLRFLFSIAKELNIYENTRVLELKPGEIVTSGGNIHADTVIVATHFPMDNKHGAYFLKLFQSRSYVLALKNIQPVDGMYVDAAQKGLSFRDYGSYLLLGGGGHRTGKKGGG